MKISQRLYFGVILATFFLSGIAGLLYQVVWTRYLALFLGHTSYAVIAVLAAFMGGLALGNAWLGSVADRVRRPLLFYSVLEIGIGAFAILFPAYYELIHDAFITLVRHLQPTGSARLVLQFGFATASILLPTVLMGATLPALTRFVTSSLAELRGRVAALYAINSTGAVVGTVATDWWWIPSLGLETTMYLGATISLGIGLLSFLLSRRETETAQDRPAAASPADEIFTVRETRVALLGIGLSGFVAMLYEVAWTRLLALALGSSTHAYSLMLATFISGIAVGGWLIYRKRKPGHTLSLFAWAEIALGLTLAISLWFYHLLPWWFAKLAYVLSRLPEAYVPYQFLQAGICFAVMFVPAVFLGMTLPLASRVATSEVRRSGRSVGMVFAVNTLGTVLGAVLTGFLFLPFLGLAASFALGTTLNLAIGTAILAQNWRGSRSGFWLIPIGGTLLAASAALILSERWQKAFSAGLWRAPASPGALAEFRKGTYAFEIEYYRDGAGSTVSVVKGRTPLQGEQVYLKVNAKTDASSKGDLSTQLLAAHVPMLLHSQPQDVLVVGLGSGISVGATLRHPTTRQVDVVEISPEVVAATSRHFKEFNHDALADPRTHLTIEDARTFLQITPHSYDVIVTEPSNPWMAGVSSVFSLEFYQSCLARLKPGGLIAQWVQAYESNDRVLDTVVATFSSVFPHAGVWQTGAGDLLIVGSPQPFEADLAQLTRRLQLPAVADDLARAKVKGVPAFLSLELVPMTDGAFLPEPETRLHSDFNPVLEYLAQESFFIQGFTRKVGNLAEVRSPRPRTLLGHWLATNHISVADVRAISDLYFHDVIRDSQSVKSALEQWIALEPDRFEPQEALALLGELTPNPLTEAMRAVGRPEFARSLQSGELRDLRAQASLLLFAYRDRRSAWHVPTSETLEAVLTRLIEEDPELRPVHQLRLSEIKWDQGKDGEFLGLAKQGLSAGQGGNVDCFKADQKTCRMVLVRMFDHFERHGDLGAQWELLRTGLQNRLFGEQANFHDATLEVAARRVAAKFTPEGKPLKP